MQANETNINNHTRQNKNKTIALFGEVLADVFPEQTVLGGAPFNVARHLKAFEQNPILISRLGDDGLRDQVLHLMSQNTMDMTGMQCSKNYPTGRVQVHMHNGAHRFEILPEQAYDYIHPAVVRMTILNAQPSLVYFGTLAQRNNISERALKSMLRSTTGIKFLDINLRSPWYNENIIRQSLQYADIVKINNEELAILVNMLALKGSDDTSQAIELIKEFKLEQMLITCGENGAWHINKQGKRTDAKVNKGVGTLADTVGAGDGFAAIYLLGLLQHWPITKTLARANHFAAAICEIRGAIPEHSDFYKPFKKEWGV